MAKSKTDYSALSLELGDILAKLQQPGIPVDKAVKMYQEGLRLAREIEEHLLEAENTVEILKLAASQEK